MSALFAEELGPDIVPRFFVLDVYGAVTVARIYHCPLGPRATLRTRFELQG